MNQLTNEQRAWLVRYYREGAKQWRQWYPKDPAAHAQAQRNERKAAELERAG